MRGLLGKVRMAWADVHQSYFVVALSVGVVVGAVMGVVFHVNYFASWVWGVVAAAGLVVAYVWPKAVFVVVSFLAGMVLVFMRVTGELSKQAEMGETYQVSAGLETETWVTETQGWFAGRIREVVDEPEAALGLSYLLGMKTGLPKDLSESLRKVGLVHIVVASGAHLAILVEVARKIMGHVSRFFGVLFAGVFVVFFMAMVGWTPSILRAGIMTLLSLMAWYVGRKFEPWRIILIVMAATLMINPLFVTNLGWLLSFASFIGIMMLGPGVTRFFYGPRKPGFVASMVITTMCATVMTLPITLYYFGAVSLISVVANLLILPTLPWAMGMVFATGVCVGVPVVADVMAWGAKALLDYHITMVGWFAGMDVFLIEVPKYQASVFVIYAVVAGAAILAFFVKKRRKMRMGMVEYKHE